MEAEKKTKKHTPKPKSNPVPMPKPKCTFVGEKKTKKLKWKRDGLMESGRRPKKNRNFTYKMNEQNLHTAVEEDGHKKAHIAHLEPENGTEATAPPSNIYNNFSYTDIERSYSYLFNALGVYPEREGRC